jgi:hypothetical protein
LANAPLESGLEVKSDRSTVYYKKENIKTLAKSQLE